MGKSIVKRIEDAKGRSTKFDAKLSSGKLKSC